MDARDFWMRVIGDNAPRWTETRRGSFGRNCCKIGQLRLISCDINGDEARMWVIGPNGSAVLKWSYDGRGFLWHRRPQDEQLVELMLLIP